MAYLDNIKINCNVRGCFEHATVRLLSVNHVVFGHYCLAHGEQWRRLLQGLEDQHQAEVPTMPPPVTR